MGVSFALPASPTAEDIFLARIFEEPLVPMGAVPTLQENAEFATALVGYAKGDGPDDFSALTAFLDAHPDSPWNGALLTDLGLVYYRRGDGGVLAGETDATDLIGGYSYITTALVLSAATVGQPYSQAFTSVMGTRR
jgi:hypothetical protein